MKPPATFAQLAVVSLRSRDLQLRCDALASEIGRTNRKADPDHNYPLQMLPLVLSAVRAYLTAAGQAGCLAPERLFDAGECVVCCGAPHGLACSCSYCGRVVDCWVSDDGKIGICAACRRGAIDAGRPDPVKR